MQTAVSYISSREDARQRFHNQRSPEASAIIHCAKMPLRRLRHDPFSQKLSLRCRCHYLFHKSCLCVACDITLFHKSGPHDACDINSDSSTSLHIKWFPGFWRKTAIFRSYDFKSSPLQTTLKHHFSFPEGAYIMSRLEISHAQWKRLMSRTPESITLRKRLNVTKSENGTSVIISKKYNVMLPRISHSAKMT